MKFAFDSYVSCHADDLRVAAPPKKHCRLLYLIGQLHSGGSERQLYYLLENMDRDRYRPAVVVWNYCERETYVPQIRKLGVPIHALPNVWTPSAKVGALRRLVRNLRPQIIHSFSFYLNYAAYWSVRGSSVIAIGSMRSSFDLDKKVNGWFLGKLSARWPNTQIYNSSDGESSALRSKSWFIPRQLLVVQNGVDLRRFSITPIPATITSALIVGVGSLVAIKRWDKLLTMAAELKWRGLDFDVQIVGSGPLRDQLDEKVRRLQISDRIVFRGHIDDIPSVLSSASLLVHTADAEGTPNAVMEAMSCGRAVVATDVGDVRFLVEDGKSGFVVDREDDAMLSERVATLLTDGELCRRMGEAGRVKAEREFGLDRLVCNTLNAYRSAGWKDSFEPPAESTGMDRNACLSRQTD